MVSTNLISQILHDFCDNLLNVDCVESSKP